MAKPKRPRTIKRLFLVTVEASTAALADDMATSLARAACDIANSTTDGKAHIWIRESA